MSNRKIDISNKKVALTETETESECEKMTIPVKHFNAILQNREAVYDVCYKDGIKARTLLKVEKEKRDLYMQAYEKTKREKETLEVINIEQEKEIKSLHSKAKASPESIKILQQLNDKKVKYTEDDDKKFMEDEYNKNNFKKEISDLKKSLGL